MIIKFCYQNEIHRCSDPPSDFLLLRSFLAKMFQAGLPRNFVLSYVNPEGETLPLNNKEDYEALQSKAYNKPVKVVITEAKEEINDDQISEYEMMDEKPLEIDENKPEVEEKELKDIMEEITEEVTKIHVVPKVQKLEGEIPQEEQVRRIVRETLEEQMPFILARLKENSSIQENVPEQKKPLQSFWNQIGLYPYYQSILQSIPDEIKVAQSQAQPQEEKNPEIQEVMKDDNEPHQQEEGEEKEERKEGKSSPKLLTKVKKAFVEFPMKAADFVDNLTHKISGDPYVECAEGKYPKSVVEKVESLKEVFEDADKKEMLDFVSKLPKDIPLFQIGDLFAIHKQME